MAKRNKPTLETPQIIVPEYDVPHRLGPTLYSGTEVRQRVYNLEDHVRDLTVSVQLLVDQLNRVTEITMTQVDITGKIAGKN